MASDTTTVPLRRWILLAMLASLGAMAVLGVWMVVASGASEVEGLIGTAIAAAIASGLLLGASRLMDRQQTRAAGLFLMVLILAEFCLCLLEVWNFRTLRFGNTPFIYGQTALVLLLNGIPAACFIQFSQSRDFKFAGVTGLILCAAAMVILLAGIWMSAGSAIEDRIWEMGWSAFALAIILPACISKAGRSLLRIVGVCATMGAFTIAIFDAWTEAPVGTEIFVVLCAIAVILAYVNLALLCTLKSGQRWLRRFTIALVCTTVGAVVVAAIVSAPGEPAWIMQMTNLRPATISAIGDLSDRLAGVLGISAACGSLALIVLARANRKMEVGAQATHISTISVICPNCSATQTVGVGDSSCQACGLRFSIKVEEPRCPNCDYLLYMFKGDRCPECGTMIHSAAAARAIKPAPSPAAS